MLNFLTKSIDFSPLIERFGDFLSDNSPTYALNDPKEASDPDLWVKIG